MRYAVVQGLTDQCRIIGVHAFKTHRPTSEQLVPDVMDLGTYPLEGEQEWKTVDLALYGGTVGCTVYSPDSDGNITQEMGGFLFPEENDGSIRQFPVGCQTDLPHECPIIP